MIILLRRLVLCRNVVLNSPELKIAQPRVMYPPRRGAVCAKTNLIHEQSLWTVCNDITCSPFHLNSVRAEVSVCLRPHGRAGRSACTCTIGVMHVGEEKELKKSNIEYALLLSGSGVLVSVRLSAMASPAECMRHCVTTAHVWSRHDASHARLLSSCSDAASTKGLVTLHRKHTVTAKSSQPYKHITIHYMQH